MGQCPALPNKPLVRHSPPVKCARRRRRFRCRQQPPCTASSAPVDCSRAAHPAYEFRRGQLSMAQAIEQALEERRHLIVEAGTGTGKTLAYLLPVLRSGKRVIISTGTKTLQEQLFYKDVPFLEEALFASPAASAHAPDCECRRRTGRASGRANGGCGSAT